MLLLLSSSFDQVSFYCIYMNVELTTSAIDFTNDNARRIMAIDALLPLAGKQTKETLAQTISPILKISGLALTVLQATVSILFYLL